MAFVTYPIKEANVADLEIHGKPTRYALPPATGTHSQCFADGNYQGKVRRATAEEIVAYAIAGIEGKNEWADQNKVRFPDNNYLRFPVTLTIVPKDKERFGELEGAMLFTPDLEGQGISRRVAVPKDLSEFTLSEGGVYERKDGTKLVKYDGWFPQERWDARHGSVIALCGAQGAEALEKVAKDTNRTRYSWKVNPNGIAQPENRVPVLDGYVRVRLDVYCDDNGDIEDGCAARVLE